ncbi:LysR family transcriptional regulator [Mesorhizobium sp. IRAMC:0171]|uniref:LysR family transcriptional regulator n=2 Tax=Mesorhizobium retamae TaxID=2912854 RepID=A0ABS9QET3_9HYPH|nr:LysR family transcriptional regulator [Mesorhizobium sp. IRAMC:0171]
MGTVSAASRLLNVSQPALTKSLQILEGRLGVTLFERIKGRLQPTPDSQTLIPEVEKLFEMLRSVEHLADEVKHGQVGRVVLAAASTLSATVLAEAVAQFSREKPRIAIEVRSLSTRQVVEAVSNNQVDVGLVDVPLGNDFFETIPLCHAEIACVVLADSPLAKKEFLTPNDLLSEKLIAFADDTLSGMMIRQAFHSHRVMFPASIVVNQTIVGCSLVRHGAGVAIIDPFPLISNPEEELRLVAFRPTLRIKPSMILPPERPQSVASEQFLATLKKTVDSVISRSSLLSKT